LLIRLELILLLVSFIALFSHIIIDNKSSRHL
jgi:hypothetical protein